MKMERTSFRCWYERASLLQQNGSFVYFSSLFLRGSRPARSQATLVLQHRVSASSSFPTSPVVLLLVNIGVEVNYTVIALTWRIYDFHYNVLTISLSLKLSLFLLLFCLFTFHYKKRLMSFRGVKVYRCSRCGSLLATVSAFRFFLALVLSSIIASPCKIRHRMA